MYCSRCVGDRSRPPFKATKPHFFKIILEQTLKEKRLHIPPKFLHLYGHTLSESVLLKLPCGSKWRIGLEKRDDGISLQEGWRRFTEGYCIVRGLVLFFEYEGNSKFNLVICDSTACEIDYPFIAGHRNEADIDHGNHRVSKKIEVEERFCSSEKGESSKRRKSCKRKLERKTKENSSAEGNRGKSSTTGHCKMDILRYSKPLGREEIRKALMMTGGFTSDRPFFKAVMQPSYVLRSRITIPASFAGRHMKHKACDITLEVFGGRSWSLKYNSGVYSTNRRYPTPKFYDGWKAFARDNNLDIGDVCIFVLTENSNKVSFQVVIFRSSDQNQNRSIMSQGHEGRGIGKKQKGTTEHETDSDSVSGFDDAWTPDSMTPAEE